MPSGNKRKGDKLKLGSPAFERRQAIWQHNGYKGSTIMAIRNMQAIQNSRTSNWQSKMHARNIERALHELATTLEVRAWPPMKGEGKNADK